MALYVDYKRKMGELTLTQGENKYKINIYACNALASFIYEYKNEEGETMCKLMNFIVDTKHLKELCKHKKELFTGKISNVKLNTYYGYTSELMEYFTEMGIRVTCFKKEPKKEKS